MQQQTRKLNLRNIISFNIKDMVSRIRTIGKPDCFICGGYLRTGLRKRERARRHHHIIRQSLILKVRKQIYDKDKKRKKEKETPLQRGFS